MFRTKNILSNNAITTDKIADRAVTAAKLDDMGASTGNVLKWNGSQWQPDLDMSSTNSISWEEADERYVEITGDTMTGRLQVDNEIVTESISITGDNDWRIGSEEQRADIILENANSEIQASNGNLNLKAAKDNSIVMKSKLQLNQQQYGRVTISGTEKTALVSDKDVDPNAVILLTPCGALTYPAYVEIYDNGTFAIKLNEAEPDADNLVINYLILE